MLKLKQKLSITVSIEACSFIDGCLRASKSLGTARRCSLSPNDFPARGFCTLRNLRVSMWHIKELKYPILSGGHPPKYWSRSMLPHFGIWMRSGAFAAWFDGIIWPLNHNCMVCTNKLLELIMNWESGLKLKSFQYSKMSPLSNFNFPLTYLRTCLYKPNS